MTYKLGVIGLSEGNGHPYSWSAIFNGFNPDVMDECPFPVIPEYLKKETYPDNFLSSAKVTHIWTQDHAISEHVAKAAKIDHVANSLDEMIANVDAILLARDDAENHVTYAAPILKAGLPVYIDKPFALSLEKAQDLLNLAQYDSQIFTCSAMRYAKEFSLSINDIESEIGPIKAIDAVVMKDWEKYAVHIIEPVISILGSPIHIDSSHTHRKKGLAHLTLSLQDKDYLLSFSCVDKTPAPLALTFIGELGIKRLPFSDTFHAFKTSLAHFIKSIDQKERVIPLSQTMDIVKIIETGRQ